MQAKVGDMLVVHSHHIGEPNRTAEVLEVHGPNGTAPYVIRWDDDGHIGLFFPGSDVTVDHHTGRGARRRVKAGAAH